MKAPTVIGTLFPDLAPSGKRNIDLTCQNYFELQHKSITVYSHGFGEGIENNAGKLYIINSPYATSAKVI
jgi:hypothetical protein